MSPSPKRVAATLAALAASAMLGLALGAGSIAAQGATGAGDKPAKGADKPADKPAAAVSYKIELSGLT